MRLLDTTSLANTVDAVNDAFFFDKAIARKQAREVARWMAARQGLPGSYAGMFAPTKKDHREGIRLFTGERVTSGAATGHILGEEACRALLLLDADVAEARAALERAVRSMDARLSESEEEGRRRGFY